MNLKALIGTTFICTALIGGAATAEAKPQEKKLKHCKQHGKKLSCVTPDDDQTVEGVCPGEYEPVELVQLPPGNEVVDLNSNFILCYSDVLGVTDDKQLGKAS
ncbi:MAG TPA: hypothetical protein VF517_08280 [Thermoleophilaceae bacterium]